MKNKKIAVIFPGIGYHVDKPLLYYSSRLARQYGYEVINAEYGILPSGVKGDAKKMYAAYEIALQHVTEQLENIDFASCGRVLFVSKSIGTAVASSYDLKHQIGAFHVYYTPVEASFQAIGTEGIVFHGTADSWARTEVIRKECEKRRLPLFLTEQANHSMETGDALQDLEIIKGIMQETAQYIEKISN